MNRHYYSDHIPSFCKSTHEEILGVLTLNNEFSTERTQTDAWIQQIKLLQEILKDFEGSVFFEYAIPRMGKRIDVLLIIKHVIFVLELVKPIPHYYFFFTRNN
jgi:hypothetical protein